MTPESVNVIDRWEATETEYFVVIPEGSKVGERISCGRVDCRLDSYIKSVVEADMLGSERQFSKKGKKLWQAVEEEERVAKEEFGVTEEHVDLAHMVARHIGGLLRDHKNATWEYQTLPLS